MLMNTAAAPFGEQMEDMEPGTELDRYQVYSGCSKHAGSENLG